jgi:Rad51
MSPDRRFAGFHLISKQTFQAKITGDFLKRRVRGMKFKWFAGTSSSIYVGGFVMRTLPISSAPRAVRAAILPSRMVTVYGGQASALGVHLAAQLACENKSSLYLCGDNRFDPYIVARCARSQQKNPDEVLGRILVTRAFTAYQLDELIHRLELPDTLEDAYAVVVVSGICTTFLDEDVTHTDAARMFYRSLWRLRELSREGLALLLAQSETTPNHPQRAHFLADLFRISNVVIRLEGERTFTFENSSGRSLIA